MNMCSNYRLPANLVELTRIACWKAFWYRDSLVRFLCNNGIKKDVVARWQPGVTKINFLSELFYVLSGSNARNVHDSILSMARELSQMTVFTDFDRKPDRTACIAEAVDAINALKPVYVAYMNSMREEERKACDKRLHESLEKRVNERVAQQLDSELVFQGLMQRLQEIVKHIGEQEWGYAFERWIYDLAKLYDLESRTSYRGDDGHQIDGSITIDGTTLLVEAKLTRVAVGRDEVTLFADKIKRRAENTRGLMVSISGFDEPAKAGASGEHSTIVMMDHAHLFGLLSTRRYTFPELLRRLLRNASETGSAYLDVKDC